MIKKVLTNKELRTFTRFPYVLYEGDRNWVPPLTGVRELDFDHRANPALEDVEFELYLSGQASGPISGRVAAVINRRYNAYQNKKTAFFSFFECTDKPAAAAELLAAVREFAAVRGMERILGPVDFSTNYSCGVVLEGCHLPPTTGTPYTKPYYPAMLEACGLKKAMDYYAYTYSREQGIPQRMARLRPLLEKRYPGLIVRPLSRKSLRRDMTALREVNDTAFAANWGFMPLSDREYAAMEQDFLRLRCLDTVFLAEVEGHPAGFLVAVPDINQTRQPASGPGRVDRLRLALLGVKPDFRGRGIETVMIVTLLELIPRLGYKEIDCSLILENNLPMNTFIGKEFGCPLTRKFRVYEQSCQ